MEGHVNTIQVSQFNGLIINDSLVNQSVPATPPDIMTRRTYIYEMGPTLQYNLLNSQYYSTQGMLTSGLHTASSLCSLALPVPVRPDRLEVLS